MKLEIYIPVLVAVLSFIGSIYSYWAQKRLIAAQALKTKSEAKVADAEAIKTDAEAAKIIGEAWDNLNQSYRNEISNLKNEIAGLKDQILILEGQVKKFDDVLSGAHRLYSQLEAHKIHPVWSPPERRSGDEVLEGGC